MTFARQSVGSEIKNGVLGCRSAKNKEGRMKVRSPSVLVALFAFVDVGLLGLNITTDAHAAPIKNVLSACDNTPGCNYK